jgi:hypothetical protein
MLGATQRERLRLHHAVEQHLPHGKLDNVSAAAGSQSQIYWCRFVATWRKERPA